jgi:8-oxo-dGTP pyrophosphatase MutT (NUDIX family)
MKSPWTKTEDITVYDARIFTLHRVKYGRDGGPGRGPAPQGYYYLNSCDWVNVVPITPERRVVLIRQFRVGLGDFVVETPGGMVDPTDASPLEAARRELREETGYGSDDIVPIGRSHPNPATQNNSIWFFAARDVRKIGEQSLDPGEDIELEIVDLADIDGMIETGRITHALVLNAFDFLKRKHPEYWR